METIGFMDGILVKKKEKNILVQKFGVVFLEKLEMLISLSCFLKLILT